MSAFICRNCGNACDVTFSMTMTDQNGVVHRRPNGRPYVFPKCSCNKI